MGISFWGTLAIGCIVAGFTIFLTWFSNRWLKANKKRELHYIKMECLLETLSTINGQFSSFSKQFKETFNAILNNRFKDEQFLEGK